MYRHYEAPGVPLETLQQAIDNTWHDLAPGSSCPYTVNRPEEGLGVTETFVVALAARVVGEYMVRALDLLWDKYIWPQLEVKFGASIRQTKSSKSEDRDS